MLKLIYEIFYSHLINLICTFPYNRDLFGEGLGVKSQCKMRCQGTKNKRKPIMSRFLLHQCIYHNDFMAMQSGLPGPLISPVIYHQCRVACKVWPFADKGSLKPQQKLFVKLFCVFGLLLPFQSSLMLQGHCPATIIITETHCLTPGL